METVFLMAVGRFIYMQARLFEIPEQKVCVAFLSNHNTKEDGTVTFRGQQYFVPRRSVSILGDCKTVVFSTQHVNSQHNQRTFHFTDQTVQNNVWEMYTEGDKVPTYKLTNIRTEKPLESYNLTKDKTDYIWYTTRYASCSTPAVAKCKCVSLL
jgi:hypothetical protein